jgi:hypothetical protein
MILLIVNWIGIPISIPNPPRVPFGTRVCTIPVAGVCFISVEILMTDMGHNSVAPCCAQTPHYLDTGAMGTKPGRFTTVYSDCPGTHHLCHCQDAWSLDMLICVIPAHSGMHSENSGYPGTRVSGTLVQDCSGSAVHCMCIRGYLQWHLLLVTRYPGTRYLNQICTCRHIHLCL